MALLEGIAAFPAQEFSFFKPFQQGNGSASSSKPAKADMILTTVIVGSLRIQKGEPPSSLLAAPLCFTFHDVGPQTRRTTERYGAPV